jgi:dihydroorotate dehydrogenase (NAD+) catalytic subunit
MAVDIFSRRPKLANIVGGLSGPAIKPVALRCVYEVLQAVDCPVIGIGGICDANDALEFLLVGARAVQVGTANFIHPSVTMEIIEGIERFLRFQELKSIETYIGTLETGCLFPFSEEVCAHPTRRLPENSSCRHSRENGNPESFDIPGCPPSRA